MVESILKFRNEFRARGTQKNKKIASFVVKKVEAKIDEKYIIYYSNIAGTVFLPCKGFAFCIVCFNIT